MTLKKKFLVKDLESNLGYIFNNKDLLYNALTHGSYCNEVKGSSLESNERLEFLGDAVLELVISEFLYKKYKDFSEGELTKMRAKIVCSNTLAEIALRLNIGEYIIMGKGEINQGGRKRKSILADSLEAIIGAIYLDNGLKKVKKFIFLHFKPIIQRINKEDLYYDYKTILQEKVQSEKKHELYYELIKEEGPDHNKIFYVDVIINNKKYGTGQGKNKKEAEQNAAKEALSYIEKF
ncbi:MAG TPA: ribonuclease III [Eubacteriaceae bacterium]|nr:ribonuclease III [Eubacteriaceae bacterium]